MCSVDPDELVEMTRATEVLDISSGNVLCRRCNTEKAVVVLRVRDAYCKDCFLSYFVHKFRSTIGKSKLIRHGDKILIATSGGMSSAALLHLVRNGLDETSHKKLRFEPAFIYIDESSLSDNPDSGSEFINEICRHVTSQEFPCYFTSLEEILSASPVQPTQFRKDEVPLLNKNLDRKEEIKQLLFSCKSESSQLDLLEQLRRELLYQSAVTLGYQKLFVADNATTLSIAILANVAVGRGSQLADRVQFQGKHKDVEVYRPMREILLDEILFYNDLHDITSLQAPTLILKGQSIPSCTKDFVMGLQKEFPATIPTVFRTGAKLMATSSDVSRCSTPNLNGYSEGDSKIHPDTVCAICGLQTDVAKSESSAMHATLISQKLSNIGLSAEGNDRCDVVSESTVPTDTCCDSQQSGCCKSNSMDLKKCDTKNISKELLQKYLCYGCRIMIKELPDVNHLPLRVRMQVAEQDRLEQMREQIQDYLL